MDNTTDIYFELNGKREIRYFRTYGTFSAAYCRTTGLPMLSNGYTGYEEYADKWLSKSRCKKSKRPIQEGEKPIAWYRTMHGYCPLYDRS